MTGYVPVVDNGSVWDAESVVRTYSRAFTAVIDRAEGAVLHTECGREVVDFLCGAGSLNYGHNHPAMVDGMMAHLRRRGVLHGLDLRTTARREMLLAMRDLLRTRGLEDYRVQFTGPTGANAVEAALKLARKITGRESVVAFSGSFHGMSRGASQVSSSLDVRRAAGLHGPSAVFLPFGHGPDGRFDSVGALRRMLTDPMSGMDQPAAVIVEPVQIDGGVYDPGEDWLRDLATLCLERNIPLICDEVQCGCGRTGDFFAFEASGIRPDIVCLSKSLSGSGMPLSVLLIRPDRDVWEPGEHTGTFRGNQLAMVTAAIALRLWEDPVFLAAVHATGRTMARWRSRVERVFPQVGVRGRGAVAGVDVSGAGGGPVAVAVRDSCLEQDVLVEVAGRAGSVVKVMPPLTVPNAQLKVGLDVVENALRRSVAADA